MKTRKRVLTMLLTAAVMTAAIPFAAFATGEPAPLTETETEREGWKAISNAEEFRKMQSGNSYYLTGDIDFKGATFVTLVATFNGVLDGQGYALKNFTLANESTTADGHMGVFGKVCDGGYTTVKNLVIGSADAPISMTNNANADGYHGFLAGEIVKDENIAQFENITVYGNYTNTVSRKYFAGGLVGFAKKFVMVGCTMNGSLTDATETTGIEKNVGGLVGLVKVNNNRQNVMESCTNNAAVSVVGTGTVRVGGLIGFSGSPLKVENCTNTATLSGTKYAGGLVGSRYGSDLYIKNSRSTGTVTGTNKGDLLGGSEGDVSARYLYITGCGTADTKVTEVKTLSDLQGMTTAGGVYKLMNDLDLDGKSFDNFVFSNANGFNGVFDGNGHSIYNFTINGKADSDAGFFNLLTKSKGTLITNLSIGTAESPVSFTSAATGAKSIGVLAGTCNNNANYNTLIDGVRVHANVTHTGGKANFGGFFGKTFRCAILNSSFSGDFRADLTNLGSTWVNYAAFVADVEADQTLFYNCTNYADITVTTANGTDVRAAGMVAYSTKNNEFIRCANFGDINVNGGTSPVVAGVQAGLEGTSTVRLSDCTNFGNLSAIYASGFIGRATNPASMLNSINLGTVTGTTMSDAFYIANTGHKNYKEGTSVATKLACTTAASDLNFTMEIGASVRLEVPAGLRFRASLNTDGLYWKRLTMHTATEYGMLISPTAFVEAATAFTREALDAYAKTLGYTEDQSAYVTVANTNAWFAGMTGSVAGTLVNIRSAHYNAKFSGIGYLDLTVDGQVVRTVYADAAQSRSVKEVSARALEDVLYKAADGKLYNADGTEYTGSDAAGYTNVVESGKQLENMEGTFDLVSPYTEAERTVLSGFAN